MFYYTPGTRYLRVIEHAIFGETFFGYLSLLLWLPFVVHALFRRYFDARVAIGLALAFIAVPVGALFGSTFYIYVKHASTGFGDSAGAILFFAGVIALIRRTQAGPAARFAPAFAAGLLLALAVFVRPNFAVGAAVLLGGAGLAALWQRQFARLIGMSLGFLPVLGMALHNWYFGHVFVLFSQHTSAIQGSMPMPPRDYVTALLELVRLDFAGDTLRRAILQIGRMLLGPSESPAMIPLHILAFAVLFRVLFSARYDGWLRLISAATLGLYVPSLFFLYSDRYLIAAWLLTLLVCLVWTREEGAPWLERRYPGLIARLTAHPRAAALGRWLDRIARTAEPQAAPQAGR